MRARRWAIRLLLGGIIVQMAWATRAAAEPAAGRVKAEQFLTTLVAGEVGHAYNVLMSGSPWQANKPDSVEQLKQQTESMLKRHGRLQSFQLIKEEPFGDDIVRLVYVLKADEQPWTFEFYFYLRAKDWSIASVRFNDEFDILRE